MHKWLQQHLRAALISWAIRRTWGENDESPQLQNWEIDENGWTLTGINEHWIRSTHFGFCFWYLPFNLINFFWTWSTSSGCGFRLEGVRSLLQELRPQTSSHSGAHSGADGADGAGASQRLGSDVGDNLCEANAHNENPQLLNLLNVERSPREFTKRAPSAEMPATKEARQLSTAMMSSLMCVSSDRFMPSSNKCRNNRVTFTSH